MGSFSSSGWNLYKLSQTWVPTVLLIAWSWRWPPLAAVPGLWRLPFEAKGATVTAGLCCCWSTQPFVIDGLVPPLTLRPISTKKLHCKKLRFPPGISPTFTRAFLTDLVWSFVILSIVNYRRLSLIHQFDKSTRNSYGGQGRSKRPL